MVKESTADWSFWRIGFEGFNWKGGTAVTASRQLEEILMLTWWDYQMKTVRMKHNCDAGSWRQNSAFAFPQYVKKLVTCYRRAKQNYLEERILESGWKSVEIGQWLRLSRSGKDTADIMMCWGEGSGTWPRCRICSSTDKDGGSSKSREWHCFQLTGRAYGLLPVCLFWASNLLGTGVIASK